MASDDQRPHVEFEITRGPDRLELLCGLGESLVQTYDHGAIHRAVFMVINDGQANQVINIKLFSIGTIDEAWVRLGSSEFSFRARVGGDVRDTQKLLTKAFEREDQRAVLAKHSVFVAGRYNPFIKSGRLWVSNEQGNPVEPVAPGKVIWELKHDPASGVDILA